MSTSDIRVRTARLRETAGSATAQTYNAVRADIDGSIFVNPRMPPGQASALAGEYFIGTNPTPLTAIATTTSQTAYDADKPVLVLEHNNSTKVVIPDYIMLRTEQVPSSATEWYYTLAGYAALDYVSGGSQLTSITTNIGSGATAVADCYFGAITSTNATKILLSTGCIKDVVPVIEDTVIFRFGESPGGGDGYGTTAPTFRAIDLPPVALTGPSAVSLFLYGPSSGAADSYEVTVGWREV